MGSEEESADAVTEESAAGDDQTKSASPESEGEAAADYLEGLLDIIDADGDIDIDMDIRPSENETQNVGIKGSFEPFCSPSPCP